MREHAPNGEQSTADPADARLTEKAEAKASVPSFVTGRSGCS